MTPEEYWAAAAVARELMRKARIAEIKLSRDQQAYERELMRQEQRLAERVLDRLDESEPVWQAAAEWKEHRDWLAARRTYITGGAGGALETMCEHVTMDNPPLAVRETVKARKVRNWPLVIAVLAIMVIWLIVGAVT